MTITTSPSIKPAPKLKDLVKTDKNQLQNAENEGLAPIVPANPAVHQETGPSI